LYELVLQLQLYVGSHLKFIRFFKASCYRKIGDGV